MRSSTFLKVSGSYCLQLTFAVLMMFFHAQTSAQVNTSALSKCNCTDSGYQDSIVINAQSGLTWNVFSQNNATLAIPIAETAPGKYLALITLDGDAPYFINLISSELDYVTLAGSSCQNRALQIEGPTSLCIGAQATFNIKQALLTDAFDWSVSNGSIITSDDHSALISFPAGDANVTVSAAPTDGQCGETLTFRVAVGVAMVEDFGCKNAINVSLDETCRYQVELNDVYAGSVPEGTALSILIEDQNGKPIPGNAFDERHIGQRFIVKILDGCGGNSCWGNILVEDKKAPEIICQEDISIHCYKMGSYPGPFVEGECSEYQVLKVGTDQVTDLQCDPTFLKTISRTYIARDIHGNVSDTCSQTIHVLKFPLGEVLFPEDTAFDCGAFTVNPGPEHAGYPTIGNTILNQQEYTDCKIFIDYKDQIVKLPGKTKIIRTWTIFDWSCSTVSNSRTEVQIIVLEDTIAPVWVNCPKDYKISTTAHDCTANFVLPIPKEGDVLENCNGTYIISAYYSGGQVLNLLTAQKPSWKLPIGVHTISYVATDAIGLTSACTFLVTVADKTAPVAVCKDSITVSLGHGSSAVYPLMLDNQSYDACGLESKLVRRMDRIATDSIFKDSVHVTCADVGKFIMIELQVTDIYGNTNACMTSVHVEDKTPPILQIPEDVTITCEEWQDNDSLSEYGEAVAYDQCSVILTETADTLLTSCQIGKVVRTFTATSGNQKVSKSQTITIISSSNSDSIMISVPQDITIDNMCASVSLHPDSLAKIDIKYGRPIIKYSGCDLPGVFYYDKEYTIVDNSFNNCKKIIRTWRIINHCQGNGTEVIKQIEQIIKVQNYEKPTITSLEPDTLVVGTQDCISGTQVFSVSGQDECTPFDELRWNYKITSLPSGVVIKSGIGKGAKLSISETLSVGNYTILYTLTDGCGNYTELTKYVKVINTKGPSVYTIEHIATALTAMVDMEMSCLNVKQLIRSSEHPCGLAVKYSFSPDNVNDTIRCFDCNDIGFNKVKVYGIDENGIFGSATVTVEVQDNNDKNICASFVDCITWPEDIRVTTCVANLEPATIGSLPVVRPDCSCTNFQITKSDIIIQTGACTIIERTFIVTFSCNGVISAFSNVQMVSAINRAAPVIACPQGPILVNALEGCEATFTLPAPTVPDTSCQSGIVFSYRIGDGPVHQGNQAIGTMEVGSTIVTYIATNACGLSSTCTVEVIVGDMAPPICRVRDVTIFLNNSGIATIGNASIFNNGSFDECNNLPLSFGVNRTIFDCQNLNIANPVIVTVADASGNATTCPANVSVADTMKPVCVARNLILDITDDAPFQVITPAQVIVSATDNCNLMDTIISKVFFNCFDIGSQLIRTVVRDRSGNSGMCESTVTVRDRIKPVCVLKSDTIIVNGGTVRISRENVDGGSFDPCGQIASFVISPDTFSCEDLGLQVVTITITDTAGNVAVCDTTIFLVDGSDPMCRAKDLTVYLNQAGIATITASDIDNGSGTGCGNVVQMSISRDSFSCADVGQVIPIILTITSPINGQTQVCTSMVSVLDTLIPTLICPPDEVIIPCSEYTGVIPQTVPKATMTGCNKEGFEMEEIVIKLTTQCGIDTFTRTFRLFNPAGDIIATCVQLIRVVNDKPLTIDSFDLPPAVINIENCTDTNPFTMEGGALTLKPGVDPGCSAIGITFNDVSTMICNDTIFRTWQIVDSCNSFAPIKYLQKIVVNDTLSPVIIDAKDILAFSEGNCGANIDLSFVVAQDCDGALTYSNDNTLGLDTNVLAPSGFYPVGIHTLTIRAEDRCGNGVTDTILIEVRDTFSVPILVCKSDTFSIGDGGFVEVTADLLADVFGVCDTSAYQIRLNFRKDSDTANVLRYTCDDLPVDGLLADTVSIELYNTIGGIDTVIEVCQTVIYINDANDNCLAPLAMIHGNVKMLNGVSVPDFEITAIGDASYEHKMTNEAGHYEIMQSTGTPVVVQPKKNGDAKTGVNTLDLLHIKRHILGIGVFDSPYKFIASDINEDGLINIADLVEIQNLILGKTAEFKKVHSWKALDALYNFDKPTDALQHLYPVSYEIGKFTSDMEINFTAVKMADVNLSYAPSLRGENTTNRSFAALQGEVEKVAEGAFLHTISLPADFTAMEWSFSGNVSIASAKASQGLLFEKYFNGTNTVFIAVNDGTSKVKDLKMEFITNASNSLGEFLVTGEEHILFDGDEMPNAITFEYKLLPVVDHQNFISKAYPNPWTNITSIDMEVENAENYALRVFDVGGRMVYTQNLHLTKGKNKINLDRNMIKSAGIYEAVFIESKSGKSHHVRLFVTD